MFSSQRRIFAGKTNLQPEPFCPYLTNESGRQSLIRSFTRPSYGYYSGDSPHARIFTNGGKSRV